MTAKRHHAVPRFYLERFSGTDGLLWQHHLEDLRAVRVAPHDAAVEKYLYAPEVGDEPHNDALEALLAEQVDGPAAEPLAKLAKGEGLADEERARIAMFIAFQEYRIPRMRDAVADFMGKVGAGILKMSAERPEYIRRTLAEIGHQLTDEQLEKMVAGIKENQILVEPTKIAWLRGMSVASEIADLVFRMPWTVVGAPPRFEFLTSDAPIVKVVTDHRVPQMFAGGWLSPSAETTFALDPETCVVIKPDGTEGRIQGKKRWCKDVNRRLVLQAKGFVFSRSRDSYVEKLANRRRTPDPPLRDDVP